MKKFLIFILLGIVISCSDKKSEDIYDMYDSSNKNDNSVADEDGAVNQDDDKNDQGESDDSLFADEENDSELSDSDAIFIPDIEPDACTPNPCVMENSDGICTTDGDTFKCGCIEDHYWINGKCIMDPCGDEPCSDIENSNGECTVSGNGFLCGCIDNYFFDNGKCEMIPDIIFVKSDATGNNDGTSWADAFTDLTDALESAGEPSEKKWIWVASGTYKPKKEMNAYDCYNGSRCHNFALKSNVAIYCGFEGSETDVSQRDFVKNETVFSGDLDSDGTLSDGDSYHVFFNFNNDETSLIDGCVIEGGNANFTDGGITDIQMKYGGGINNYNEVKAVIRNTVFRNNYGFIGGGMANLNNSAPIIENCTFENNSAVRGGGMGNSMSSPRIISSKFKGNFTVFENTGFGGAIFNNDGSSPEIENSVFENNDSIDGGAIVNLESSHPVIVNSIFKNNTAARNGGAISNGYGSDPDIINSVFESNSSVNGGGAVEIYEGSYPRIVNSRFLFNDVSGDGFYYGGGVLVTSSSIDIINSLFVFNSANSGGGIASQWSIVNLVNGTVTLNFAKGEYSFGGGVYSTGNDGETYIVNSIVYDNYADNTDDNISNDLTLTEVSYSNISGCLKSGYWDNDCGEDKDWNIDLDPMFRDINAGDFSLSIDSPCIDAGSSAPFKTDGIAENIFADLLGNDRIMGEKIDMGAYEFEKEE